ncbi:MAG: hypothetical protein JNK38_20750 [Acidobacteria bacterium]|nr:hypothetical protein [Acidobacteriota bacterium]
MFKTRNIVYSLICAFGLALVFSAAGVSGKTSASATSLTGSSAPSTCFTICFRSPEYYLSNPKRILRLPVLIWGENYNNPTNDPSSVYFALRGPGLYGSYSPIKFFNQQFVAAQLSLANAGGDGSPTAFSALKGELSCYGLPASPVTLSNGVVLNSQSTLGDLFAEARDAIVEKRTVDFEALGKIFEKLYVDVALSYCP